MSDLIPQEAAVEAGGLAVYEMTRGATIPGVIEGIEATHVGTANISRAALGAAVPFLYAAWREALLSEIKELRSEYDDTPATMWNGALDHVEASLNATCLPEGTNDE